MPSFTLLPARYRRGIVLTFFGLLLALGLGLVRDYSVSYDEGEQRVIGQVSLLYVFQLLPTQLQHKLLSPEAAAHISAKGAKRQLATFVDRDYGVAFELPMAAVEQALRIRDERQVYLLRHVCTFLVCYLGFVAFYIIAKNRFGSWRVGLLGTLLLVMSPRLFADYFYNDKDTLFMALLLIAVATAIPFIRQPTWQRALWHALACAIAIDVRIMGIILPAATLAFVGLRAVCGEYRGPVGIVAHTGLYLGGLGGLVVAMWPFLWAAPLAHFSEALANMSHFRYDDLVLYQGKLLDATKLPWHYALVWIGMTVPLPYLFLLGLGVAVVLAQVMRQGGRLYASEGEWQDLLFLGLAVAPLLAVIALHSVLYNGWRQLYFIYPMLLLLALRGLVAAWRWQWPSHRGWRYWQPALGLAAGLSLTFVARSMVRLHPFENLYFNALAPAAVERVYEADYWGLSLDRGLAWVAAHDERPLILVYATNFIPLEQNRQFQPAPVRERLKTADGPAQADYLLITDRMQAPPPRAQLRYAMQVEGMSILNVYQLR